MVLFLAAGFGLAASQARAQVTVPTAPPRVDTVAPRFRPDGAALSALTLTYLASLQQGADVRALGERSVDLRKATYAGLPGWEMVETHGAGSSASVDTLMVDAQSLAPLHWGATQQLPGSTNGSVAARVSAEFRADTMIGIMSAPSGRRTMVAPVPAGGYMTAAHLETALRALPLAAGYRDSIWVQVTDLAQSVPTAAALEVTGEEKLTTPAGTFDCWVLSASTESARTQYWVAKAERVVVKTTQVVPETGDVLVYLLTRISH